jgi:hypothetical protein
MRQGHSACPLQGLPQQVPLTIWHETGLPFGQKADFGSLWAGATLKGSDKSLRRQHLNTPKQECEHGGWKICNKISTRHHPDQRRPKDGRKGPAATAHEVKCKKMVNECTNTTSIPPYVWEQRRASRLLDRNSTEWRDDKRCSITTQFREEMLLQKITSEHKPEKTSQNSTFGTTSWDTNWEILTASLSLVDTES